MLQSIFTALGACGSIRTGLRIALREHRGCSKHLGALMIDMTFPSLNPSDARALLAAYEQIVATGPAVEASPEDIVRWLLEDPTELQVSFLKTIAEAAPAWVTPTELGEVMNLEYAALGGVSARIHSRVSFRYGENHHPWERDEKGDVV